MMPVHSGLLCWGHPVHVFAFVVATRVPGYTIACVCCSRL